MKITKLILIATAIFVGSLNAQDLVKNVSFEHDGVAPNNFDGIHLATGWDNANGGTVDLYSSSASKSTVGVPNNYQGMQAAYDGNSYAGIIAYQDDKVYSLKESVMNMSMTAVDGYQKYSEYIQCKLTQPLVAGKRYRISYQASLSDRSTRAVSNLGAAVTTEEIMQKSNAFINVEPAFVYPDVVTNKEGWSEISGIFTAKGGEKFMTIGVFGSDNMQKKKLSEADAPDYKRAYYYIDGLAMLPDEGVDFNRILNGDNVVLTKLNFDLGKSTIRSESYPQLDKFAQWLKSHNNVGVSIDGHTDKSGSSNANLTLSKERAESVKAYLMSKGVTSNLFTRGFGDSRPLVKGGSDVNEKNRRVEISLNK
ncbi:MAG: OOP family OmpA-OmpF porin [Patiriisocius sp.]|jgi:OOP family OmpA-OmpF porin